MEKEEKALARKILKNEDLTVKQIKAQLNAEADRLYELYTKRCLLVTDIAEIGELITEFYTSFGISVKGDTTNARISSQIGEAVVYNWLRYSYTGKKGSTMNSYGELDTFQRLFRVCSANFYDLSDPIAREWVARFNGEAFPYAHLRCGIHVNTLSGGGTHLERDYQFVICRNRFPNLVIGG